MPSGDSTHTGVCNVDEPIRGLIRLDKYNDNKTLAHDLSLFLFLFKDPESYIKIHFPAFPCLPLLS